MSEGEYAHKFSVGAVPGEEELPNCLELKHQLALENAVTKSGYKGRFLVHYVNGVGNPPYTGFEIEFQGMPTPKELKKMSKLILEPIDF